MRDEKGERKKQARSNKQTRQSNTAHVYMYIDQEREADSGIPKTFAFYTVIKFIPVDNA